MKILKNKFYILITLFILSCTTVEKHPLATQMVNLPTAEKWCYLNRDTVVKINEDKWKLIIYLKNYGCAPCSLSILKHWNSFLKDLEELSLEYTSYMDVIFIMNVDSQNQLFRNALVSQHFTYPILCDEANEFENNNTLAQNDLYNTYLVNENNEIIFVGSPLLGSKMRNLYLRLIRGYINSLKNHSYEKVNLCFCGSIYASAYCL